METAKSHEEENFRLQGEEERIGNEKKTFDREEDALAEESKETETAISSQTG